MNKKWIKTIIILIISLSLTMEAMPISVTNGQVYAQENSGVSGQEMEFETEMNESDVDRTERNEAVAAEISKSASGSEKDMNTGEMSVTSENINNVTEEAKDAENTSAVSDNETDTENEDNNIEETPSHGANETNADQGEEENGEEKNTVSDNETSTEETIEDNPSATDKETDTGKKDNNIEETPSLEEEESRQEDSKQEETSSVEEETKTEEESKQEETPSVDEKETKTEEESKNEETETIENIPTVSHNDASAADSTNEDENNTSNAIFISEDFRIEGFERESENLAYNGKPITQNISIYHNDILLKENVHYILNYRNNIQAASYDSENAPSVTIVMKGQYTGSYTLYFTILPGEIEEAILPDRNIKDVVLGEMWQDEIVFSQSRLEEEGGIYQSKTGILKYIEEAEGAGEQSIETGKQAEKIEETEEQSIETEKTEEEAEKQAEKTKETEEGAEEQAEKIEELVEGIDYTVKYWNVKDTGTATVIFRGMGRYEGILLKTYSILPNTELVVHWLETDENGNPKTSYQKDGAAPKFELKDKDGNILENRRDYAVRLKNNRELGRMKCEIAGKGNYKGFTFRSEVQVVPADIGKATMIAEDRKYSEKADAWKASIEIKDVNGRTLRAGKDYEKELIYSYDGMENTPIPAVGTEILVTAQGKNNYADSSLTGSYRICKQELKDFIIEIDNKEYTGHEIELQSSDIHVYADKASQKKGMEITENCYEITGYQQNTRVGFASVTLRGVGVYGGTRTCYFFIGKKRLEVLTIPITYFELNSSRVEGDAGSSYQLKVTQVTPEKADITNAVWKSSNPSVADVDSYGLISLNTPGMAVITVSFKDSECVRKCMVWVKSENGNEPQGNYLTPQMFKEEGDTDDTDSFNRAIESLKEYGYDTVYVPPGTYTIDAEKSIRLKSNMNLMMSPDAILQAAPNSSTGYNIVSLSYISNTTISGGQIVGERNQHGNAEGEWGMGIGLYDSKNIILSDVKVTDCWGDGIYLGTNHDDLTYMGCKEITVTNCTLDNNRRNNLSIVSGEYVTIDGCTFTNANGTDPQFGIDIETNNSENPCKHIVISNSEFSGNAKGSVGIMTAADDVTISNCSLDGTFNNYAGTKVTLSNTQIFGEAYARIGVSMRNGSKVNTGSRAEDILIASFDAGTDCLTLGAYNQDSSNKMMQSYMDSSLSPSGKVLRLERMTQGTKESGYYFNLADLTFDGRPVLETGCNYRYEYVIRGYGEWGIDTDQNGWYPCVGQTESFTTGITCYVADKDVENCRLIIFARDKSKGMSLEIDSIKIYKVQ